MFRDGTLVAETLRLRTLCNFCVKFLFFQPEVLNLS